MILKIIFTITRTTSMSSRTMTTIFLRKSVLTVTLKFTSTVRTTSRKTIMKSFRKRMITFSTITTRKKFPTNITTKAKMTTPLTQMSRTTMTTRRILKFWTTLVRTLQPSTTALSKLPIMTLTTFTIFSRVQRASFHIRNTRVPTPNNKTTIKFFITFMIIIF